MKIDGRKILFFDIDGTLVNFGGVMPETTKRSLKKARENGHMVVICSGRSKYQVYPYLLELSDGLIGCAGAYVEYQKKVIYGKYMEKDVITKIVKVLKNANSEFAAMTDKGMILSESCKEHLYKRFEKMGADEKMIKLVMGPTEISENLEQYDDIRKILYYDSEWNLEKVKDALEEICDVVDSSFEKEESDSGEISTRGINKAYGMEIFLKHVGLKQEDSIAFGDGPNDLEMIEYANIGVCMGNGRDELKKKADFITKSVNDDGIEFALKELGII